MYKVKKSDCFEVVGPDLNQQPPGYGLCPGCQAVAPQCFSGILGAAPEKLRAILFLRSITADPDGASPTSNASETRPQFYAGPDTGQNQV